MQQLPINPRTAKFIAYVYFCIFIFPAKSYADIARRIEYGFTLQNTANEPLKKVEFRVYAPVKENSIQKCLTIKASFPYDLTADDFGNQTLHFTFEEMAPFSSRIIKIEARLFLSEKPRRISPESGRHYIAKKEYVESDDPEIKRLAAALKSSTSLKTAENIYKWICENVKDKGFVEDSRGAMYALKNKKGDCTEQAYLFCALCRANNIPSRVIGGYISEADTILKPAQYHNWAEFYVDGFWRVADPQGNNFLEKESGYIAMTVEKIDGIKLSTGTIAGTTRPLKVTMND